MKPDEITKKILLDSSLLLGSGRFRDCYNHPTNPSWVVKIQRLDSFNYKKEHSPHLRELRFYEKLTDNKYFAELIGAQQTNLGLGLVFKKIQNADGSTAPKLYHLIRNKEKLAPEIYEQVFALINQLEKDELLSCSAYAENILILHDGKQHRIMSCDSKEISNKQMIGEIDFVRKNKIRRRYNRLRKYYKTLFDI